MSQNEVKATTGKVFTQILGFVGVIALVSIEALIADFTVDRWIYVGMMGFMLGVRPETIPDILKAWSGK